MRISKQSRSLKFNHSKITHLFTNLQKLNQDSDKNFLSNKNFR